MTHRVLFILGTRPEAIKLKPIIELANNCFEVKICLTNQHPDIDKFFPDMLDGIIQLPLHRTEKGLADLTGRLLSLLDSDQQIKDWSPSMIIVHGDTTSALCGAMYAHYNKISLAHVEAGLRTHNKQSPFPEESNRRIIDYLSDIKFAPTECDKNNLNQEQIVDNIFVVGNSIIDVIKDQKFDERYKPFPYGLVTLHRRENWDSTIELTLLELAKFANDFKYNIVYVCNNNTKLKNKVHGILANHRYIKIRDALEYSDFIRLLNDCSWILTDSGGIQEESVFLKKPLLIMRENTERQGVLMSRCGYLVSPKNIYTILEHTIDQTLKFDMDPFMYGCGDTAHSIIKILYEHFLH